MQKNNSNQHQLGTMSCIYHHPKVTLTEHSGVKTFLHMTTDNFCFQWMNPEGVEWYLISFPIESLLQKAPHLEMCWKMMDYNKWIINSVSPSQHTAALMKKDLLLCNLPLGLLPSTQCCSHKCILRRERKCLAVTFLTCLYQSIDFYLKFTTSRQGKKRRTLLQIPQ